ncbi:MAG TPA: cytochrome c [Candidatus Acidoferrales bacterium]|nr:cytochrome c [Candidatus Acidoferrales bacterium]
MRKFWSGIVVGVALFVVITIATVYLGWLPAAADSSSMRFEPIIGELGLGARIARQAPSRDVSNVPIADLVAGAHVYHDDCAACHGFPNQTQSAAGSSMFPRAPRLLSPDGMVTDDSAGETYWKVKNGIRLSGMPSFAKILDENQMWQVTAVVKQANKLPAEVLKALQPQTQPAASGAAPAVSATGKSTP